MLAKGSDRPAGTESADVARRRESAPHRGARGTSRARSGAGTPEEVLASFPRFRRFLASRGFALGAAASILGAYLIALDPRFGFGHDEACYVGLAGSLATGEGYRFGGIDHAQYPPGFPALLALVALGFGTDFLAMQLVVAALGLLACGLAVRLPSDPGRGRFVALAWSFSIPFHFAVTTVTMAESAFAACAIGFLVWASREPPRARALDAAVGAVLLSGAVLTRTIGVAFVLAAVVEYLLRARESRSWLAPRARRLVVPVLSAVSCAIAWFAWSGTRAAPRYDGAAVPRYLEQFLLADPHRPDAGPASISDLAGRIGEGAITQLGHVAELLTNASWLMPAWWNFPIAAVAALLCAGAWIAWTRGARLAVVSLAGYLAILAVWPYDEGSRFLLPVGALLVWLAIEGIAAAPSIVRAIVRKFGAGPPARMLALVALAGAVGSWSASSSLQAIASAGAWIVVLGSALAFASGRERLRAPLSRAAGFVVGIWIAGYFALGAISIGAAAAERRRGIPAPIPRQELRAVSDWLARHVAPHERVLATDAAALRVASGREVFRLPVTADPDRLHRAVEATRARYLVIVDPKASGYYRPAEPERLRALSSRLDLALEEDLGASAIWRIGAHESTAIDAVSTRSLESRAR